jgi:hypothetical protein
MIGAAVPDSLADEDEAVLDDDGDFKPKKRHKRSVFARGGGSWTKKAAPPPDKTESPWQLLGDCYATDKQIHDAAEKYGLGVAVYTPKRGRCYRRLEVILALDHPQRQQIVREFQSLCANPEAMSDLTVYESGALKMYYSHTVKSDKRDESHDRNAPRQEDLFASPWR